MQAQLNNINNRTSLLDQIRNDYWHIRNVRPHQQAKRRKYYRKVAKIKAILIEDGLDPEWLRLYCRQFASLDRASRARFEAYNDSVTNCYKSILDE